MATINFGGVLEEEVTRQEFTIEKAKEKALSIGIAIGSGYLFETTFEKEV